MVRIAVTFGPFPQRCCLFSQFLNSFSVIVADSGSLPTELQARLQESPRRNASEDTRSRHRTVQERAAAAAGAAAGGVGVGLEDLRRQAIADFASQEGVTIVVLPTATWHLNGERCRVCDPLTGGTDLVTVGTVSFPGQSPIRYCYPCMYSVRKLCVAKYTIYPPFFGSIDDRFVPRSR